MTDLPPSDIQWEAPAECPSLSSVRAATERLLGKPLESLSENRVRATGSVKRNDAGNWELHVVLAAGEHVEEDTLVAKRCQALGDAMALKVALAIDPLAVVDSVQPPPEPVKPKAEPRPQQRAVRAATRSDVELGVRVVAGVGVGPLPGVSPGAALLGSLQFPQFRLELGAEASWGGVARYGSLPNVGADLSLFASSLRGCVTPGRERWFFPICGGIELGVLRGAGFGVDATATTTGLWGAVMVGPALQFRMTSRLSLWVEADASLTILSPEFHMRNLGSLYSPQRAGSRAWLGIELKF